MHSSTSSAVTGAVVGAVVGAVCLTVASTVAPTNMYAATVVRPVVSSASTVPITGRSAQMNRFAAPMAAQQTNYESEDITVQAQGTAVYGWAFALFATVAGAVNGVFLLNSRRSAMASTTGRREALMAGVAAAGLAAGPAFAAYGDSANVFGKPKDVEQVFTVSGEGWSTIMPSKYNYSKEKEFPGIQGRWEDNFDAVNNASVTVQDIGKSSVTELGNLDQVRDSVVTVFLGKQVFGGDSISEGGFAPGRFSAAAVLAQQEVTKGGKTYYEYEILTRTADGNEGGRHQLYSVAVSNGKLYVFKTQAGDKRWFKGLEKPLRASVAAFTVA